MRLAAERRARMHWIPPHGPWDDQMALIFDGGQIDDVRMLYLHDGHASF